MVEPRKDVKRSIASSSQASPCFAPLTGSPSPPRTVLDHHKLLDWRNT